MNEAYQLGYHFQWQKSFGISTLGKSQLPIVLTNGAKNYSENSAMLILRAGTSGYNSW